MTASDRLPHPNDPAAFDPANVGNTRLVVQQLDGLVGIGFVQNRPIKAPDGVTEIAIEPFVTWMSADDADEMLKHLALAVAMARAARAKAQ